MALNVTALNALSTVLQTNMTYAQLHSASAGISFTDNIADPGRLPITWGTLSGGSFGMVSQARFMGGTPGGAVHSVTVWDSITDGECWGEFALSDGDSVFNAEGQFILTALDVVATAEDA